MTDLSFNTPKADPFLERIRRDAIPLAALLGGVLPRVVALAIAGRFLPLALSAWADLLHLVEAHQGRPPTQAEKAIVAKLLRRITGSRRYLQTVVAPGARPHSWTGEPLPFPVADQQVAWAHNKLGDMAIAEQAKAAAKAVKRPAEARSAAAAMSGPPSPRAASDSPAKPQARRPVLGSKRRL